MLLRHSHGGTGSGSAHNLRLASLASCSSFSRSLLWGAYSRNHQPKPAFTISLSVSSIRQDHVANGTGVAVLTFYLDVHFLTECKPRRELLSPMAKGLSLLRAINSV